MKREKYIKPDVNSEVLEAVALATDGSPFTPADTFVPVSCILQVCD